MGHSSRCLEIAETTLQLILHFLNLLGRLLSKLFKNVDLGLDLIALARSQAALGQDAIEPGQFLGDIVVILAKLVENADVVLGVLGLNGILNTLSLL